MKVFDCSLGGTPIRERERARAINGARKRRYSAAELINQAEEPAAIDRLLELVGIGHCGERSGKCAEQCRDQSTDERERFVFLLYSIPLTGSSASELSALSPDWPKKTLTMINYSPKEETQHNTTKHCSPRTQLHLCLHQNH